METERGAQVSGKLGVARGDFPAIFQPGETTLETLGVARALSSCRLYFSRFKFASNVALTDAGRFESESMWTRHDAAIFLEFVSCGATRKQSNRDPAACIWRRSDRSPLNLE
jgi:hypothetical protein